ncbi:MAG: hypothetical protein KKI09_10295 [Spirochaetes bacterium]|nr:hypothetical protein [Spirochaetota bacterium]MBU0955807.1 hypothetical protein [Spirochaetota bacterium]
MKQLICDVCKKIVDNPIPSRTFFHYREFDLCEICHDDLDAALRSTVRSRQPFDFAWHEKMRIDLIRAGVSKNRIAVPK